MAKSKIDQNKCLGCGACVGVCPQGAITTNANGKSVVDTNKCIGCGACAGVCPAQAIKVE